LSTDDSFKEKIYQANIAVHRKEAQYYELIHPEVYGKQEQKRIAQKLQTLDKLISNNQKNALDIGAGTGNLTGRLLQMGYNVVAVDISAEMCAILKSKFNAFLKEGELTVVNSPVEKLTFEAGKFDLITFYSLLHHLPDYQQALASILRFLKTSGVIYIDHEASPFYWKPEPNMLANIVKGLYYHSSPILNILYFQLVGAKIPHIDYTLSDYWHKKEHALSHQSIGEIFRKQGFEFAQRTDYYEHSTWIPNPLAILYRLLCKPELSYWIAKK
jgi:ubiquinone/menaquinone biosynthesis C-methylase UbiE